MLRLQYKQQLATNCEIELSGESAHHLINVMRTKIGDQFKVFNTSGEFIARLVSINKSGGGTALIETKVINQNESPCHITLLQAVTRRERMDFSIQKATELGVNCIQPVLTEHCVVKLDQKKAQQRITHWQGIAQHASEQSGRIVVPEIKPVLKWQAAVAEISSQQDSLKLIFALLAAQPLASIKSKEVATVFLALGPVGGFSSREVQLALDNDFKAIKLGPRILRSETATTAALTAIQMTWGI